MADAINSNYTNDYDNSIAHGPNRRARRASRSSGNAAERSSNEGLADPAARRGNGSKRRPRKPSVPAWEPSAEQLALWAEEAREREAAAAAREASERKVWVDHQQQLMELGRSMPLGSGRAHFMHLGCVAAIMAEIDRGGTLRDDILINVNRRHRYSFRHTGYMLTKLTGSDPQQHIWEKGEDRHYRLLNKSGSAPI